MKVAVLVSGGVDSAVALRLMQQQGHQVSAYYLKIWLEDELAYLGNCPWQEDLSFVEQICVQANIPLEVLSLQKEYHETVVAYTVAQAKLGNTPNPDVFCNSFIKFGFFLEQVAATHDKVVTGHYAYVRQHKNKVGLFLSADAVKDQTYFLAYLKQEQLAKAIFPLFGYTKTQVRALARDFDLPNKDRKDSQGICFLGMIKFRDFLKHHLGTASGIFVEYETGSAIGKHEGAWFYTVGQRQGMGLSGGPWYVVAKDIATHTVFISRNYRVLTGSKNIFLVTDCNWIGQVIPADGRYAIKIRHGEFFHQGSVTVVDNTTVRVTLVNDDQGIAAGQFAVFYKENECLGAGVIKLIN